MRRLAAHRAGPRPHALHRRAIRAALLGALAAAALLGGAGPAQAAFGLHDVSVSFTDEGGAPERRAGSHPFAMRTAFAVNTTFNADKGVDVVDGALRDLDVTLPAGLVGNPTAVPQCETIDFLTGNGQGHPGCTDASALGVLTVAVGGGTGEEGKETVAVYNMRPAPGSALKLGFLVAEAPIVVEAGIAEVHPYRAVAHLKNTSQLTEVLSSDLTLWGSPAAKAHDKDRGDCAYGEPDDPALCPAGVTPEPFLTLPRSCGGPLETSFDALSWWSGDPVHPSGPEEFHASVQSPSLVGCSNLDFGPTQSARPSSDRAESPSGLDFELSVHDEGIANPAGLAAADIAAAEVLFPEGMTANPSLAAGLLACSPQDLARETLASAPGEGCPSASKLGTLEARTPVLEERVLRGELFLATPNDPEAPGAENPFDELIAQYVVIKDKELGLLVKQAGFLDAEQASGRLRAVFEDLPPFPLSSVHIHLKEGGRSPLITPPVCGTHTTSAGFVPSSDPGSVLETESSFAISRGVDGGPCPSGPQPFEPSFAAGSQSNIAAAHTPFHLRLQRRDGDQDLTRFDATLPPGLLAKLAGVAKCPDQAIAAARTRSGRAELASPSCPAASRIGTVQGGAGVGSQLTWVPGSIHLAGPVAGAPLSVVAIVPAVAGPFDVGTVVVRQALRVDPKSARVSVDGSASDPLPHILAGIPLRVRDIRVDVSRGEFVLNPTDCSPFAVTASIWGGGANVFSSLDDSPVSRSAPFQAADCAALGFKPRLSLTLRGGKRRGAHPALTARYRPRPGEANLESAAVRLPRSAFLDQAHIRTICTRVQFALDACPAASIYGSALVRTPLLEEPLSGPVYLRSSEHKLPDMVLDLHGLLDVEVSARIDSIRGGIRATVTEAPDAPLTEAVISMRGAGKGLVQNSTDICARTNRANVALLAQSGKRLSLRPALRALGCGGKGR